MRVGFGIINLVGILWACSPAVSNVQRQADGEGFFSSAGVTIRYVDRGAGEPVILLHGYTGTIERHLVDTGVIQNLEQDHRVIAIDLRGHGGSGKPHEPEAYGAEMAQDVIRLLDHLGMQRAHVIGYSLGAHIVGNLVAGNADRIATATLVGSAPYASFTIEQAEALEAEAVELESAVPFRSLVLRLTPAQERPTEDQIRALSASIAARNDVLALAAFQRGFRSLVVSHDDIAAARVPILAVIGSEDRNLKMMQMLKTGVPGLDLTIVEGATHGGDRGVLRRHEFFNAVRRLIDANRLGA